MGLSKFLNKLASVNGPALALVEVDRTPILEAEARRAFIRSFDPEIKALTEAAAYERKKNHIGLRIEEAVRLKIAAEAAAKRKAQREAKQQEIKKNES